MLPHINNAVPPMPRDKRGWRVAPAPDGRGMPEEHKPSPPHRLPWFWVLVLGLLAVNFLSVLATQTSGQPRVRVPFSRFFLDELQAGQVRSISSKADTIHGRSRRRSGIRRATLRRPRRRCSRRRCHRFGMTPS